MEEVILSLKPMSILVPRWVRHLKGMVVVVMVVHHHHSHHRHKNIMMMGM